MKESDAADTPAVCGRWAGWRLVVFLVVIAGNIVQAFASTGPPPFMGQGDPIRFSFNPQHWVWSLEEWSPAPVSLRGRWAVEKPGRRGLAADPAHGPLANLPRACRQGAEAARAAAPGYADRPRLRRGDRPVPAHDSAWRLHRRRIAESGASRATIVDPGFSIDLGRFAGAAFLDSRTVMAVGENKSYVILTRERPGRRRQELPLLPRVVRRLRRGARSRLGTVRARMMYMMSLAFDPAGSSLYTVTVPNSQVEAAGDFALRPGRPDAVGGVRAGRRRPQSGLQTCRPETLAATSST